MEILEASEVHGCEEQIAEFFGEMAMVPGGLQLPEFFFDFGDDVLPAFPVETDASDLALDFVGLEQGRQVFGEIVQDAVRVLLGKAREAL